MATLTLTSQLPSSVTAQALVVGTAKTDDGVALIGDHLPPSLVSHIEQLASALTITGAAEEIRRIPAGPDVQAHVVVLAGLGKRESNGGFSRENLRRTAGAAVRSLEGLASAVLALPSSTEQELAAVCEGALLGSYSFSAYRSEKKDVKEPVDALIVASPLADNDQAQAVVDRAQVVADAVNGTRDLVNTPPNVLYPESFADEAQQLVKAATKQGVKGLRVTVLDDKALLAGGYGGIMGVGQGSVRLPRLVKISYTPSVKDPVDTVGLVGKGITFDTGGISLKPGGSMHPMSMDMAGAAVALHVTVAAARLRLPLAVNAYLCLAENMPSGCAQRPDDVITIRGGKTVEVRNTDAEGRLVMADGLVDAVADGADVEIDIATLTGAQIVALGQRTAGVMGTDDAREAVYKASGEAGELAWPMPIPADVKAGLKSDIADLINTPMLPEGGMLLAAAFLAEFVGDTPWAHLDIAGPAWNTKAPWGYQPKGATGHSVRTLVTYLESRSQA